MVTEDTSAPWPAHGEIWYVQFPGDPAGKGPRPVVVVSVNYRNRHPRASTVLVIPLTTWVHKASPTQLNLPPGETGLAENSLAMAENITVVAKQSLLRPRRSTRLISHTCICEMMRLVSIAAGCADVIDV